MNTITPVVHTGILKALAHPARLCIINQLLRNTCCVSMLGDCMPLSQPNLSQHLAILKKAGIVKSEIKGSRRCYSLINTREMKRLLQALYSLQGDMDNARPA